MKKKTNLYLKTLLLLIFSFQTALATMDTMALPKALNIENTAFSAMSKYSSGIKGVPFIYNNFYPLGYSDDGKIAYIEDYDTTPADVALTKTFIQDLVNDKILWEDEYEEENLSMMSIESFWEKRATKIQAKLKEYGIKPFKNALFKPNTYSYKNNQYRLLSKSKNSFRKVWGKEFLGSSTIILGSKNLGDKVIDKQTYKDEHILARKAIGFIPLGDSDRIAVVVANVHRGWEGPPHNLSYDIVGASLRIGFKR